MNLSTVLSKIIVPTMALLPPKLDSVPARINLLAIGLQESRFKHRVQVGGPAHGFWQFERGGGVIGVLRHPASKAMATRLCAVRKVSPTAPHVYAAIVNDDILACAFARLLLWTDPKPLPAVYDVAGAWDLYLRTWRPGKPHPKTWGPLYSEAVKAIGV